MYIEIASILVRNVQTAQILFILVQFNTDLPNHAHELVLHAQIVQNLNAPLTQSGPLYGSVFDFQQVNVKLYTQDKRLIQGCQMAQVRLGDFM